MRPERRQAGTMPVGIGEAIRSPPNGAALTSRAAVRVEQYDDGGGEALVRHFARPCFSLDLFYARDLMELRSGSGEP